MQGDAGAARRGVLVFSDGEGAPAVGGPLPALRVAGAPGRHVDSLGDHEGGVEANTELADEVSTLLFNPELLHEGSGAGTGDGDEVVDKHMEVPADDVGVAAEGFGCSVGLGQEWESDGGGE